MSIELFFNEVGLVYFVFTLVGTFTHYSCSKIKCNVVQCWVCVTLCVFNQVEEGWDQQRSTNHEENFWALPTTTQLILQTAEMQRNVPQGMMHH